MAQRLMNPTRNHEVAGSIPGLTQWLNAWHCCELWCRLAATAPIRPLAWEPPYDTGVGCRKDKKNPLPKWIQMNLLKNRSRLTYFKNKLLVTKEDRFGGRDGLGLEIGQCTLWCKERLASRDALYSTGNSTQYLVINYMGKE